MSIWVELDCPLSRDWISKIVLLDIGFNLYTSNKDPGKFDDNYKNVWLYAG